MSDEPHTHCSAGNVDYVRGYNDGVAFAARSIPDEPQAARERCDGADDLEHLDGMFDDRERG